MCQGKFKKRIELDEKDSTTYENLWSTAKAVLKKKFIALDACIKKQ